MSDKMESIHVGEWWSSVDPSTRYLGRLEVLDDGGPLLHLTGLEGALLEPDLNENHEYLLGLVDNVGEVTLWRNHCVSMGSYEFAVDKVLHRTECQPSAAYFDTHLTDFVSVADPSFSNFSAKYSVLQEWLLHSGLDAHFTESTDITIDFSKPEAIRAHIPGQTITIGFGHSASLDRYFHSIRQITSVGFESDEDNSLTHWLEKSAVPFQELVTLMAGVPSRIVDTSVLVPDYDNRLGGHDRHVSVKFRAWRQAHGGNLPRRWIVHDSLVPLWKALPHWQELLTNWFRLREELDSVAGLYLNSKLKPDAFPYTEAELLSAAQAIESYHDRRRGKKGWSFKRRLKAIFDEQSALLDGIVQDPEKLAESVKNTRNYFVHFSKQSEERRLQGLEMIDALDTLWSVVECLILEELGFVRAEATELVKNTKRYRDIGNRTEIPLW